MFIRGIFNVWRFVNGIFLQLREKMEAAGQGVAAEVAVEREDRVFEGWGTGVIIYVARSARIILKKLR